MEHTLLDWTRKLGGTLLDPLKTTIVQDQRCADNMGGSQKP